MRIELIFSIAISLEIRPDTGSSPEPARARQGTVLNLQKRDGAEHPIRLSDGAIWIVTAVT